MGIILSSYLITSEFISFESLILFIASIFSFVFCFYLFYEVKEDTNSITNTDIKNYDNKLDTILILLCIFILIYFSIRSYSVQVEFLAFYRNIYFTEPEKIFGSILAGEIFNRIFIPFVYLLTIFTVVKKKLSKLNLLSCLVCLAMITFITQGRFPVYHLIYFVLILIIALNIKLKIKTIIVSLIAVLAILAFSIFLILSRLEINLANINTYFLYQLFIKYFINYHFVGLFMFDSLIENSMYAKETFFACNSFGYVGDSFRRIEEILIGSGYFEDCYRANNSYFLRGVYIPGLDGSYNAFGTNLMPLYLDGGWIAVITTYSILGYVCATIKTPENMKVHPIFIIINFTIVFGAFQSLISDPIFQFTIIMYFIYLYVVKFVNKLSSENV
jgi:oligosaccharide repeat unit polymerase